MEAKRFSPKRLRRMRKKAKMTQFEMAGKLNLEPSTISAFERGVLLPNPGTIRRLAGILQCEEEDLYG